ncbi:MAG: type I glyceraldehyde-3-phosphate dehydrogenase [Cytophagales bacterium]|nr:MAG: type I glyceraldehyde-3-phosphate dehydrogenase [Cytophagales bacterium]TAF59270.1 MAG: type I glyceraldehyde-3-phosphate dehydrogenase [Cytophagales bacterium]
MSEKPVRIAINGFGRIGRCVLHAVLAQGGAEVVAINAPSGAKACAHLFKYDSVFGVFRGTITADDNAIVVNSMRIPVFSTRQPAELPWRDLKVDVVLESTGKFLDKATAGQHIQAGAKKVVLSAPAKDKDIVTVVLGVNDHILTGQETIISNASCTTNCLAPMAKALDDAFGIEKGFISTVHAYTSDQNLLDGSHRDLRRARAAALSIIPTTTGAAKALGLVMPHLKGKLDGGAMRVPVPNGSLTDLTVVLKKETNKEELNAVMKKASEGSLKGILAYSDEPIVSIDIIGNSASCIFDSEFTFVNGNLAKVIGWYDNEMGYAYRTLDLMVKIGKA